MHFEGRINKIFQIEDEEKDKSDFSLAWEMERMGLPFTVMEKIREEERLVYLFVLGDN